MEKEIAIQVHRHRMSSMGRVGARGELRAAGYERDLWKGMKTLTNWRTKEATEAVWQLIVWEEDIKADQ